MEVSGQIHVPAALSLGNETPVPIGQEAGWDSQPVEKKFHHLPCREWSPGRPSRSLVTILTELPRDTFRTRVITLIHKVHWFDQFHNTCNRRLSVNIVKFKLQFGMHPYFVNAFFANLHASFSCSCIATLIMCFKVYPTSCYTN